MSSTKTTSPRTTRHVSKRQALVVLVLVLLILLVSGLVVRGTWADIKPYMGRGPEGGIPKCPQGGVYIIGRLDEDPTCSIGVSDWPNEHTLNYNGWDWWINFKMAYGKLLGLGYAKLPNKT